MQPETAAPQIDAYYWRSEEYNFYRRVFRDDSEILVELPDGELKPENIKPVLGGLMDSLKFYGSEDIDTRMKFVAAKARDQIGILFFHPYFEHIDALAKLRRDILKEEKTPIFGGGIFTPAKNEVRFDSMGLEMEFGTCKPRLSADRQELIAAVRASISDLLAFYDRVKAEVAAQKA